MGNTHIISELFNGLKGLVCGLHRIHVPDIQAHGLADFLETFGACYYIKTFYGHHHLGVCITMMKVFKDGDHMGYQMDHTHAAAHGIGHGCDELRPRHIFNGFVVGRIGIGLAQILAQ